MKKRSRRKARQSAQAVQGRPSATRRGSSARAAPDVLERRPLLYKVIELSNVDERSLEQQINHWVGKGWELDGVQFAMRESSKRPSMAFLLFTREGTEAVVAEAEGSFAETTTAESELAALAQASAERAHARLRALASDDDERGQ